MNTYLYENKLSSWNKRCSHPPWLGLASSHLRQASALHFLWPDSWELTCLQLHLALLSLQKLVHKQDKSLIWDKDHIRKKVVRPSAGSELCNLLTNIMRQQRVGKLLLDKVGNFCIPVPGKISCRAMRNSLIISLVPSDITSGQFLSRPHA